MTKTFKKVTKKSDKNVRKCVKNIKKKVLLLTQKDNKCMVDQNTTQGLMNPPVTCYQPNTTVIEASIHTGLSFAPNDFLNVPI